MALTIFLIIIVFIIVLQSAIPFLLKRTVAFGVTIPEGHTDDPTIASFKKKYAAITFITGLLLLIAYFIWAKNSNLQKKQSCYLD